MNEMKFLIPSLPGSMNSLYNVIFSMKRIEMKPEARLWKTQAKGYIPPWKPTKENPFMGIDCKFMFNVYFKNGKVRKIDTQNMMKLVIDAVSEKIGVDDAYFKAGSWSTEHNTDKESVEVKIYEFCD
jgi:Holliday junction resolvase RusA-like endonuclease